MRRMASGRVGILGAQGMEQEHAKRVLCEVQLVNSFEESESTLAQNLKEGPLHMLLRQALHSQYPESPTGQFPHQGGCGE